MEREILRKLPGLTHLDLRDNLISHIDADGAFLEVQRVINGAVDPHTFFKDPDLVVFLNADPDPAAF